MAVPRRSSSPTMNVMVTVDEGHRDQLESVAGRLVSAGMNVADKFALGGVIVGEVETANLAKLHQITGIKTIEEEPSFFADR